MVAEEMHLHPLESQPGHNTLHEDMELASGSSDNEMNENYSSGLDANGNESHSGESVESSNGSSYHNGKDGGMLVESSESLISSEQPTKAKHKKQLMKMLQELRTLLPPEKRNKGNKGKSGMLATLKYALRCIKQVKDSSTQDHREEKSFFCRISNCKKHESGVYYHPFRMTPYLLKVQEVKDAEEQLCSVLFAERVHSGYEAVPLLGYLPQDLEGTPVLLHLHPSDRPLLLAIHMKIFQNAGQPFEYSPIRFRTRNGEYITIDSSWSSFINPWSRKISLIIGRHKVRTGPVNVDVFAAVNCVEDKGVHTDTQEITEQIYRMLLKPVHNSASSGYGSLGSNGSREHLMSGASSSNEIAKGKDLKEKTGIKLKADLEKEEPVVRSSCLVSTSSTLQEICKDVHIVKNQGQQVFIESRAKLQLKKRPIAELPDRRVCDTEKNSDFNEQRSDFIKYIERDAACNTAQSTMVSTGLTCKLSAYSYQQINCLDSVIRYLESCSVPVSGKRKCESLSLTFFEKQKIADITMKRCREMIDNVFVGKELVDNRLLTAPSRTPVIQEKEVFKKMGLTKEVLAEHTQKEEHSFLSKFKGQRRISVFESRYNRCLLHRNRGQSAVCFLKNNRPIVEQTWRKGYRNRKSKSKCVQPHESSDSTNSETMHPYRTPLMGLNNTAWSNSEMSQASYSHKAFPAVMPTYPLPIFPRGAPYAPDASGTSIGEQLGSSFNSTSLQLQQFSTPLATQMVALVIPNYIFPETNSNLPPALFPAQSNVSPNTSFHSQSVFTTPLAFAAEAPVSGTHTYATHPFHFNPPNESKKNSVNEQHDRSSCSSTPQSILPQDRTSHQLFQSRCSSPLQLDLLQLERAPRTAERLAVGCTHGPLKHPSCFVALQGDNALVADGSNEEESKHVDLPMEDHISDACSNDLLDILRQKAAANSGIESASSGSRRSIAPESLMCGSNGCNVSRSKRGTSVTSHNSKYFGSLESSENKEKSKDLPLEESGHFLKNVLQDPIGLLIPHDDNSLMMMYQIPSRNVESVLKEDREKLKSLQRCQPRFTEDQKKEVLEVHPWIKMCGLPEAVDFKECIYCEVNTKGCRYTSYDEETLEMGCAVDPNEECSLATLNTSREQSI